MKGSSRISLSSHEGRTLTQVAVLSFLLCGCQSGPKEGTVDYEAASVTGSYKETREGPTTYTATFSGEPSAPPLRIETIDIFDTPPPRAETHR